MALIACRLLNRAAVIGRLRASAFIFPSSHAMLRTNAIAISFGLVRLASSSSGNGSSGTANDGSSSDRPALFQLDHVAGRISLTLPDFFRMKMDYTFYRPDVVLEDRIMNIIRRGINQSMYYFGSIALIGRLNASIQMEALSIISMQEDGTVRLRWRIKYITFFMALTNYKYFTSQEFCDANCKWYDGYSIFYVDGDGLVYRHIIQKVMQDSETVTAKTQSQKIAEKIGMVTAKAANNVRATVDSSGADRQNR